MPKRDTLTPSQKLRSHFSRLSRQKVRSHVHLMPNAIAASPHAKGDRTLTSSKIRTSDYLRVAKP